MKQFIIIKLRDQFPVSDSRFIDVDDVFGIPSVGGCAFQKRVFYGRFGLQFGDEDGDVIFTFGFVMEVEVVACLDAEFVGFVGVLGFEFLDDRNFFVQVSHGACSLRKWLWIKCFL